MTDLTVHRNTVERRRKKELRDDAVAAVKGILSEYDVRAFAFVALDAEGRAIAAWDTGKVMPLWAFPGAVMRVLDHDIASSGVQEDFRAPLRSLRKSDPK